MKVKFGKSNSRDFDYMACSDDKELMDDLYDFLMFDTKRHKDNVKTPLYTSREGIYYIDMMVEHVERILTTYSHH